MYDIVVGSSVAHLFEFAFNMLIIKEKQRYGIWYEEHPYGVGGRFPEDVVNRLPCCHLGVVAQEIVDESDFIGYEHVEQ